MRWNSAASSDTTIPSTSAPGDDDAQSSAAAASASSGYAFFEDQYAHASAPTPQYATYEDQLLAASAKNCEPPKQKSEHEKLVDLHAWGEDSKTGVPILPENYGWNEEWGPEPGEEGHNAWYKKDRTYMSTEEKAKYDMGMQCAVRKNMIRHQEMPYQKKVGAGSRNMVEDQPMFYSTKDKGVMAPYTDKDKRDYVAPARQQFIDEWLDKPGVEPQNIGKKIGDYNGTTKKHTVKAVPRKPDWQLSPVEDV